MGDLCRRLIAERPDEKDDAIAAEVRTAIEDATTTPACVRWYRNKMKKAGR